MRRKTLLAMALGLLINPAQAAERLISVGGAVSEWLVVLGGEQHLVAVDSTSRHPLSLSALPNVGYQRNLTAEGILALQPDALIGTEEMGPPPVLAQLKGAGVNLYTLSSAPSLPTLEANLTQLGALLGREAEAQAQYQAFQAQLAQLEQQLSKQSSQPGVLLLLSHAGGNPMVAGTDTAGDWLIKLAGGHNLASHEGYKPMTSEALLALAPHVLVVTDRALTGAKARAALLEQQPALAATPAGLAQRLPVIDPTLLVGGVSPRVPKAVAELAQAFYPALQLPSSTLAGSAP